MRQSHFAFRSTLLLAAALLSFNAPAGAAGPAAPPARVPAPKKIRLGELQRPIHWPSALTIGTPKPKLEYQIDLDLIAPLGDGAGNLATWMKDFAKESGSRVEEWAAAEKRRIPWKRGKDDATVLPGDDPLLREFEPWVDQKQCRFYPEIFPLEGPGTRIPNLLMAMSAGKSWIARGWSRSDPALAREDFRRTIRLGRLLRQESVTLIQELIGVALIRLGLEALWEDAQRSGDALEVAVVGLAHMDSQAIRWETTSRVRSMGIDSDDIHDEGILRRVFGPSLNLSEEKFASMLEVSSHSLERHFRFEAMVGVWAALNLGTRDQKTRAKATLDALANESDPIVAGQAKWYLATKVDKKQLEQFANVP